MTEGIWDACEDSRKLLLWARPAATDRQLRLFACAFWRWHSQRRAERTGESDHEMNRALEYAEHWAEEGAPRQGAIPEFSIAFRWHPLFARHAFDAAEWTIRGSSACGREWIGPVEQGQQIALIREVFGNPFRPVVVSPQWRSGAVLGLARAVYEERAFELSPLLADALEEAGADAMLFGHLQRAEGHVRGCWAVDVILKKE